MKKILTVWVGLLVVILIMMMSCELAITQQFTVVYDGNGNTGGTVPSYGVTAKVGTNFVVEGNSGGLSRIGFDFTGWNTKPDGSGYSCQGGSSFAMPALNSDLMVTFFAQWQSQQYTLTFDLHGGVASETYRTVAYDNAYRTLPRPTRPGYRFLGWYTSVDPDEAQQVFAETIYRQTENTTVHAWWSDFMDTPYVVNYYLQDLNTEGYVLSVSNTLYTTIGSTAVAEELEFEHFTLYKGHSSYVPSGVVNGSEQLELHLFYTRDLHTVTYDSEGGSSVSAKTVRWGSRIQLPVTVRTGYTFNGWWTGAGGTGTMVTSETTVAFESDHTLYANWIANSYTLTFNVQGGNTPIPAYKEITYNSTYGDLSIVDREGYSFAGWWSEPEGAGTQITSSSLVTVTGNQIVYAKWTLDTYTITFDTQGGTTASPTTMEVTYGVPYGELASTTWNGHTFQGWWTSAGTQITSSSTVTVTCDQIVYAKWTPNTYTITFDAQGGINLNPASKTVIYGESYGDLATTVKVGHIFAGWWTGAGGTGTEVTPGTSVAIESNQTLYAKWVTGTYTITFDTQGGTTATPTTKVVTYGSTYGSLASTVFEGSTFAGWWTEPEGADGTGTMVTSETTVATTSNQTLYVKWIATYDIGATGPAGGLVFYDKGSYSDGWRYLEAAPNGWYDGAADPVMQWGDYGDLTTAIAVGAGESNTTKIVSFNIGMVAAKACADYSVRNGETTYDDWFLPSKDELNQMYLNLYYGNGFDGFSFGRYWSSSESNNNSAWNQLFNSGGQLSLNKYDDYSVRPVRAF